MKPTFGKIELAKLRASDITRWRDKAAQDRRKPDTVNRLVSILKAALNRAWREDGIVADDAPWRMVKRLKGRGGPLFCYSLVATSGDSGRISNGRVQYLADYERRTK